MPFRIPLCYYRGAHLTFDISCLPYKNPKSSNISLHFSDRALTTISKAKKIQNIALNDPILEKPTEER